MLPSGIPIHRVGETLQLAGRPFCVRLGLDDYDLRPPSIQFVDPATRRPLRNEELPVGTIQDSQGRAQVVRLDKHPSTGLPFLCIRGIREYHEHPQHTGDDWMLYRGDSGLFAVVQLIWRSCVANVRPMLVFDGRVVQLRWDSDSR
ncbi:MAG: putative metal-binding protein [Polyangiales bacterium]